jgi:hypothetical protein
VGNAKGACGHEGLGEHLGTQPFVLDSTHFDELRKLAAQPTPEPASLTLLSVGAALLAVYRWRRRCLAKVQS